VVREAEPLVPPLQSALVLAPTCASTARKRDSDENRSRGKQTW
jgi:hypothetical protein